MGNSNDVPKEDPQIEIDTTNVGFVNMSESAVSTWGGGDYLLDNLGYGLGNDHQILL